MGPLDASKGERRHDDDPENLVSLVTSRMALDAGPKVVPEHISRRFRQLDAAFPDASLEGWQPLQGSLESFDLR